MMVIAVFLLVLGCSLANPTAEQKLQNVPQPTWEVMLKAYGIITFLFDVHPSVLTILVDMDDKMQLPIAIFGGFGSKICQIYSCK